MECHECLNFSMSSKLTSPRRYRYQTSSCNGISWYDKKAAICGDGHKIARLHVMKASSYCMLADDTLGSDETSIALLRDIQFAGFTIIQRQALMVEYMEPLIQSFQQLDVI